MGNHYLLAQEAEPLVSIGSSGRLDYRGYSNRGGVVACNIDGEVHEFSVNEAPDNKMIDFSYAGYRGGGVAIPRHDNVITLHPDSEIEDDHSRIQEAIDKLALESNDDENFRGALLLTAGKYHVSEELRIGASGIVIRGEGQHSDGTVIEFTSTRPADFSDKTTLFQFAGGGGRVVDNSTESEITDDFVPCGARVFTVASASNFSVGDRVMVTRAPKLPWIKLLGMDELTNLAPPDRNPPPKNWTFGEYQVRMARNIVAIDGNQITVDAPLTHSIEDAFADGFVSKYSYSGAIREVGIEQIRLESVYASDTDEDHGWVAVDFTRTENAWAQQVTAKYFAYSCVSVGADSQYITVEDCSQLEPKSEVDGGRRYSFAVDDGSFILFQRCYASEGRHDFVTGSKTLGPIVFVDCLAEKTLNDIGPHHRYAEGLLFDNNKGGAMNVQNRLYLGSGHGWAGAQTVFWNCDATSMICDAPKAAMNFAIGCVGEREEGLLTPEEEPGIWESEGVPVTPRSLYYKQLEDRLGSEALLKVTTPNQRQGRIWTDLSNWQHEKKQLSVVFGDSLQLNATSSHTVPNIAEAPVIPTGWSVVGGSSSAVEFSDVDAASTLVSFSEMGTYELRYDFSLQDQSGLGSGVDYIGSETFVVTVAPRLVISPGMAAVEFDTDSLQFSGGVDGYGALAQNEDGSEVAVFTFDSIHLTNSPTITGSRPIVLVSKGDLRVDADITLPSGDGGHNQQGKGIAGGGDGGNANRSDSPGNPYDGQGAGGSSGNSSGSDDSSSGGGGFGGTGGDGSGLGGMSYGDLKLESLVGGSGAGGTRNKGGGAGGGAIALIAANVLEIAARAQIDASGGAGSSSGGQLTSGGGSGGAILLRGEDVIVHGTLDASGGNGGNAGGGQLNGGGGGGGRIAIHYVTSYDPTGSSISVDGGSSNGSNPTGQPGEEGTVYTGLHTPTLPANWLSSQSGEPNPEPEDWLVDYDGDGLSALLEYAMGGTLSTTDTLHLPELIVPTYGSFDFAFNRSRQFADVGNYRIETSSTLQSDDWTGYTPNEYGIAPHPSLPGFDRVTVPIDSSGAKMFVRLVILLDLD